MPAETCDEIKRSEGQAVSGKYWFSTVKSGTSVLAYCDMKTNGEFGHAVMLVIYNRRLIKLVNFFDISSRCIAD